MTTDNGSELVRKVVESMDATFARDIGADGRPLHGGVHANKAVVARAAIKTTLEELARSFIEHYRKHGQGIPDGVYNRFGEFARANGISLEPESDGGQQDG